MCLPSRGACWRSGSLCAEQPIFLSGSPAASARQRKKNAYQYKYHNNSSVDRYVFQSLYFILSVGHGPVKCPLLKLEVVHVQFLCEHATWRHSNLERKQKKSFIFSRAFVHPGYFFVRLLFNPPLSGLRPSSVQVSVQWWGCMYLKNKVTHKRVFIYSQY